MGYTTTSTDLLLGLGSSAISDSRYAYAQNEKKVEDYYNALSQRGSAVAKGHILSTEDVLTRKAILQLACRGELDGNLLHKLATPEITATLKEMEDEGLIYMHDQGLTILHSGHPFIRNICSVFDRYYQHQSQDQVIFSKAI